MGRLRSWLAGIPQRFWFVPALCIAAAMLLAQVLVAADRAGLSLPSFVERTLFATGVDGSRALLTAVASFLGVAGTAFSITISVIATASTTYGPRLVHNFMRDRNNQIVLGVLVATFVYTLLVLRTIHSETADEPEFVPHLAVNAAIVLGVIDVLLFVWFIHHIAGSVQVDNLVKGSRDVFLRAVQNNWLDSDDEHVERFESPAEGGAVATLGRSGYLTRIDARALASDMGTVDCAVRLLRRVGDQVMADEAVALVWPPQRLDDALPCIRDHLHVGVSRTTTQDVRFAEQQVVELAVRALSPGTNDPYTAINAIEEVAAGILTAVGREETGHILIDDAGAPRLYLDLVTAEEIVDMPFDHLRPYALESLIVLRALVDLASRIRAAARDEELARRADRHVDHLVSASEHHLTAQDHETFREYVAASRIAPVLRPPAEEDA